MLRDPRFTTDQAISYLKSKGWTNDGGGDLWKPPAHVKVIGELVVIVPVGDDPQPHWQGRLMRRLATAENRRGRDIESDILALAGGAPVDEGGEKVETTPEPPEPAKTRKAKGRFTARQAEAYLSAKGWIKDDGAHPGPYMVERWTLHGHHDSATEGTPHVFVQTLEKHTHWRARLLRDLARIEWRAGSLIELDICAMPDEPRPEAPLAKTPDASLDADGDETRRILARLRHPDTRKAVLTVTSVVADVVLFAAKQIFGQK